MTPDVSVIMACHNASAFVEEAVRSVLGQTHRALELIVVDDGSTDDTVAILERLRRDDPGRVHLLRQRNAGPYPARNRGLAQARGAYVAFLDADDWWAPTFVERLLAALADGKADLAYCGWQNVGRAAQESRPYVPPPYEDGDLARRFLKGCPWPIHGALTRRQLIEQIGGFSERRFASMDYDLWIRLFGAGVRIRRVAEVLAFYRWHGDQISSRFASQTLSSWRVRREFVKAHPELVAHIPRAELRDLVDGHLLRQAYRAYWARRLPEAQRLFRESFRRGVFSAHDLRYVLPSLLPRPLFTSLVAFSDRRAPELSS